MKTFEIDLSKDVTQLSGAMLSGMLKEKLNFVETRIAEYSAKICKNVDPTTLPLVLEIAFGGEVDTTAPVVTLGLEMREVVRLRSLRRKLQLLASMIIPDAQHLYTLSFEQIIDCELHL